MPARRYFYTSVLPKNTVGAEIGVLDGGNATRLLDTVEPKKLYLIDPWDKESEFYFHEYTKERYNLTRFKNKAYEKLEPYKSKYNIEFIQEYSVPAAENFDDGYLDWVYLDAAHDYKNVKIDLAHWLPKVKKGGFICGHDLTLTGGWAGVDWAVSEFVVRYVLNKGEEIDKIFSNKNKDSLVKTDHVALPENIVNLMNECEHLQSDHSFAIRSYAIQVGDWVEKLDLEKVKEESLVGYKKGRLLR